MSRRRNLIALIALAMALIGPGTAANGRSLPYTGIDAGLIALLGVGMLGTGYFVRRCIARQQG